MDIESESTLIDATIESFGQASLTVDDVVARLALSMSKAPSADRPAMVWMRLNGETLQGGWVGLVQRENARRLMRKQPPIGAQDAIALIRRERRGATN